MAFANGEGAERLFFFSFLALAATAPLSIVLSFLHSAQRAAAALPFPRSLWRASAGCARWRLRCGKSAANAGGGEDRDRRRARENDAEELEYGLSPVLSSSSAAAREPAWIRTRCGTHARGRSVEGRWGWWDGAVWIKRTHARARVDCGSLTGSTPGLSFARSLANATPRQPPLTIGCGGEERWRTRTMRKRSGAHRTEHGKGGMNSS